MTEQLWRKSAHELAAMIKSKTVSSREVVTSHLERISEVNHLVNAVTVTLEKTALEAADKADAKAGQGAFHGVPFTIKENIDLAGSATTNGLPAFAEAIAEADAPSVARMKQAGAIPLARTNMPEMGLRITTDNPLRGRTNNPFEPARTAGGSSGGEGASISTGMSPIGLGNDIGGSLRNPAYCCGITSLKPTTGRVPLVMSIPAPTQSLSFRLMAVEGPMARTVKDLDMAYRILSGAHPKDPFSSPAALDGPAFQKKAGLVTNMPFNKLPDATLDAIRQAGKQLEAEGWQVDEIGVPELERVNEIWALILAMDIENSLPVLSEIMSAGPVGFLQRFLAENRPRKLDMTSLFNERDRLAISWSAMFEQTPVIIGPTWGDIPFLHDADLDEKTGIETTMSRLQFITPGNALGIPSVALPMGIVDGLATGVQIYGDRWREDICLQAAAIIEAKVGQITPINPKG